MSPLQLAKAHCANLQSDGSCLGVYYNNDLSIRFVRPLPKCLLAKPIQRCPYFDEVIAPMKLEHPSREKQDKMRREFADAVHEYRMAIEPPKAKTRICRKCGERDTGSKSKQLCEACRIASGKESRRRAWHKLQAAKTSNSAIVSASTSTTPK